MKKKREMKKNKDINALLALLIWAVVAFFIGIGLNVVSVITTPKEPQDTIWEYHRDTVFQDLYWYDTITHDNIIDHYITKTDTVYGKDGTEIALNWEKKTYADTLTNDGDTVSYKAYVAGINPSLDSITFKTNHKVITNTEIAHIQPPKQKKKLKDYVYYGFGVSAGYDPFINKPVMCIGASAGIRL